MPKEFILQYDNHALQYINQQPKISTKHVKWIEFLQNFTSFFKHINGSTNKVVDALSRRTLVLQETQIQTLGFENLKDMYQEDLDFKEAHEACEILGSRDRSLQIEYMC